MKDLNTLAMEIDPQNAEYMVKNYGIKSDYEMAQKEEAKGDSDKAESWIRWCRRRMEEYNEQYLTPANIKVGDGVSICLWSDRHAATVIKVTKTTVTVRQDKATLDPEFKPEWVAGGFAGHCTNQDEQSYTYEPDPDGAVETFHWSNKYQSYGQPGNPRLIKGRHEFYDYNF